MYVRVKKRQNRRKTKLFEKTCDNKKKYCV